MNTPVSGDLLLSFGDVPVSVGAERHATEYCRCPCQPHSEPVAFLRRVCATLRTLSSAVRIVPAATAKTLPRPECPAPLARRKS